MTNKKAVWVSPNDKWWWRVHKEWWKKDIAHITTKDEAIKKAREIAKNQETELMIQKKDWKIWERNSYWKDLFPPKW